MCQINCNEQFEIKMLDGRIHRLHTQKSLLDKLLGNNRLKRRLINAIGSVSKKLFGTLTESDLEYINSEIDNLYKDNKVLANSISNQTRIIKALLSSASYGVDVMMEHSKENIDNFNKMKYQINNNTRNLFISNQITACTMILQELSEDVNLIIDAINDGKHGIIHPQLLTPRILIDELREIEENLNVKHPIEVKYPIA